jgi:hypothetical protein
MARPQYSLAIICATTRNCRGLADAGTGQAGTDAAGKTFFPLFFFVAFVTFVARFFFPLPDVRLTVEILHAR